MSREVDSESAAGGQCSTSTGAGIRGRAAVPAPRPAASASGQGEAPRCSSHDLKALSDADLLEGIRASSEAHFSELYDRYFLQIHRYVERRMKGHGDPEEVAQEVFLAVFRSLKGYRGESSLVAWIYGVAKNTLNAMWRREAQRRSRLEGIDPAHLQPQRCLEDCTPEEHLILRQYVGDISDSLDGVSDWQSEVFAMRHLENRSIGEISARTQRTSESIRSSLYRTKRLFFETAGASRRGGKRDGVSS